MDVGTVGTSPKTVLINLPQSGVVMTEVLHTCRRHAGEIKTKMMLNKQLKDKKRRKKNKLLCPQ